MFYLFDFFFYIKAFILFHIKFRNGLTDFSQFFMATVASKFFE